MRFKLCHLSEWKTLYFGQLQSERSITKHSGLIHRKGGSHHQSGLAIWHVRGWLYSKHHHPEKPT